MDIVCLLFTGTGEDHEYLLPILEWVVEQSFLHCESSKPPHLLKCDGLQKNRNVAIYVLERLLEKYPDGIIESADGNFVYDLKEWQLQEWLLVCFFLSII